MNNTEKSTQKLIQKAEYQKFNISYYLDDIGVRKAVKEFISQMGLEPYTSSIMTMLSIIGKEQKEVNSNLSGTYKKTIDDTEKGSSEITVINQERQAEIIKKHEKFEKRLLRKGKTLMQAAELVIQAADSYVTKVENTRFESEIPYVKRGMFGYSKTTKDNPDARKDAFVSFVLSGDFTDSLAEIKHDYFEDTFSDRDLRKMGKGMPRL